MKKYNGLAKYPSKKILREALNQPLLKLTVQQYCAIHTAAYLWLKEGKKK